MNRELLIKWVIALQSGEYRQTTNKLKNHDSYCVLGVIVAVHPKYKFDRNGRINFEGKGEYKSYSLPGSVALELDLYRHCQDENYKDSHELTREEYLLYCNDGKQIGFLDIAQWLIDEYKITNEELNQQKT